MQLRQAEPLRVFDQHDRGPGHVDPDLDDRRGHEDIQLGSPEAPHDVVALLGLEPSVHQPHAEFGPACGETLRHRGRGPKVGALGLLDDRQHHVGLASLAALRAHELHDALPLTASSHRGADGAPARRPLTQRRDVEVSVQGEGEGARDRRSREQQHVGRGALADQRGPLLDAEPVLLVDHHQPQPVEGDALLHQRVSPHDEPRLSRAQPGAHRPFFGRRLATEQQLGSQPERRQQLLQRRRVLLGQELGRRHERGLKLVLDGKQHREEGDHRLPGADVAHEEAVHPVRRGHVGRDFAQRPLLISGELPGERHAEPGGQLAAHRERHAAPTALGHRAGADEHELQVEQLVEGEPPASRLRLGGGARPVDRPQRIGERREAQRQAERRRQHVVRQGDERVEMAVHQPADGLVAQALGGRVDRQHLAPGQRLRLAIGIGQHHEFAGRHLAPMVEADRPRDEQRLAHRDGPIKERLARPNALEHAAVVPQHGVEDAEPAPCRQHSLGHHPPDARDLLPHFGAHEGGDCRCIDVAMGKVPEEIPGGTYAEPLQLLGTAVADALEKLDGGVEPKGAAHPLGPGHHRAIRLEVRPIRRGLRRAGAPQTAAGRRAAGRPRPHRRRGNGWGGRARGGAPPRRRRGRCHRAS